MSFNLIKTIKLVGFKCHRCSYKWLPRNKKRNPKVCPKCKSPYWDRPRRKKKDIILA